MKKFQILPIGVSDEQRTLRHSSDYQDVAINEVNSSSDFSLKRNRMLNSHLRKHKNLEMDLHLQKDLSGLQGESQAMVSAASGSTSNLELVVSKESLPNAIRKISIVVEETEQNNASQMSGVEIGEENLDSPLRRRRLNLLKSTGDIVHDTP